MKRAIVIGWLLSATAALLILFQIKQEVRELEHDLRVTHRQILKEQESLHILQAEWSYLNRPERIARLAEQHLQLAPLLPEQTVDFADLPWRLPADALDTPDAAPANPDETPTAALPKPLLAQAPRALAPAGKGQGESQ